MSQWQRIEVNRNHTLLDYVDYIIKIDDTMWYITNSMTDFMIAYNILWMLNILDWKVSRKLYGPVYNSDTHGENDK